MIVFALEDFCGGGLVAKSYLTLATPWTVACQAPLSMGFCRQEYWSGLPFPTPGDLPDPRTEPASLALQADSLPLSYLPPNTLVSTWSQKEERKVTSEHREGRGRETG